MKTENGQLDEMGFIFLGKDEKHYLMRMYGGQPWICYWNHDCWVTLRACNQMDVWAASATMVTDENILSFYKNTDRANNLKPPTTI